MANWRSYIDPSIGDGQNTINGIIANGATYGLQISDDLSVTGLSTFSDIARFSSTIRLDGQLRDGDNNFGSSGQVLSSDGTDTRWINAGDLAAGAASLVSINDDSNTNASRFLTFVDSSSGNNSVKTDPQLTYNPSTNVISTAGVDLSDNSKIRFGNGNDLRISHTSDLSSQNDSNGDSVLDGSTWASYIQDAGTGPLIFKSNGGPSTGAFQFYDTSWRPILKLFSGSSARAALYYAGLEKLITSSTGVTVTGTATATAFSGPLTGNVTGNLSGNAATATILATTRSIGGVNFNGSADINLPGVNQAGNQNTSGNAATATVLETTRAFSISGEITANSINFNGSGNVSLNAIVNDNIIDYDNLKASNRTSATNGMYLRKQSGNTGGMTWEDIPVVTGSNLSGNTLASGITASSLTSVGTLNSLSVSGTSTFGNNVDINGNLEFGTNNYKLVNGNNANNLYLITGTTGASGLSAFNSSSQWRWQIYGDGTSYGFLDANWGSWDIRKTINGTFQVDEGSGLQRVWNAGNDGSGSGLDADTLDGTEANALIRGGAQSSVSGWHINGYRNGNGTSPHMYFSHSSGYGMHINTYNTSNTIYAFELHNNSSVLFQVWNSGRIVSGQGYVFVAGMIVMYTGSSAPTGWAICNGQNGTPDLRDRFVIGAGNSYSVNATGGEATKTLGTANLPSHTHTSGTLTTSNNTHNHTWDRQDVSIDAGYRPWPANNNDCSRTTANTGDNTHSHTISGNTGDQGGTMGQSFSILPPYYALMFIMKL